MTDTPCFSSRVVGFLPRATDAQLATLLSHLRFELHHRGVETTMTLDALESWFNRRALVAAPRKDGEPR
jgi:hypothetical protein